MSNVPFLFCGPCENRKSHRQANFWCSVCMEGLCRECDEVHKLSKLSKDHSTFDDNHYPLLKPFLRDIKVECDKHNKKFDFFCQNHCTLCCVNCIMDNHRQCGDVKPVDDEIKSPRASTIFSKLEQDLTTLLENIDEMKSNRTVNIKELNTQKEAIVSDIQRERQRVNEHFDKLEKKILEDLTAAEQKHSLDIAELLFEIDTSKQVLVDLQNIASCLKQIASGVQTFLATKKVENLLSTERKRVQTILYGKGGDELRLSFHLSDNIKKLHSDLTTFGLVEIKSSELKHPLKAEKRRSSIQSVVSHIHESTDPNRIILKLVKRIKTSKRKSKTPTDIRGCTILPGAKLLFADWSDNKKLVLYNDDGTHDRDIGLTGKPYDIARLDGERIAVSFPEDNTVQIFDVVSSGYPIYQTITMPDQCWAIFYSDNKLYVGCNGDKVHVMNLSGQIVKTVPAKVNTVYCITVNNDYIYYSDEINNTVYCCDFEGIEVWKFREPTLKYPCSVVHNSEGHVFVTGNISQNIMVTSSDGQQSKTLLSKLDGLDGPSGIHYDDESNRLLVVLASFKGLVALYDVVTKPRSLNP